MDSQSLQIDLDNKEFQTAWKLIAKTNQSVFLTGKAGTGKSTFLKYICENTNKKHIILAPTGIAAVNVGGNTLHSFFKMPLKPLLYDDPEFAPSKIRKTLRYTKEKVKLIREVDLIIIDEISMVRADMIDFIDKVLRTYNGNMRDPFGGKQLLLVGDVFQLEPVVTNDMKEILRHYYKQFFFFNANAFSTINLVAIELKKIYRQNNREFISILDNIRVNKATKSDLDLINSRYNPQNVHESDELIITLATRRDTVDVINEEHMDALPAKEYKYSGKIEGEFPVQNLPTNLELSVKEGAQVIFIKNDKEQRWVNGTLARVSKTTKQTIEVEMENGDYHTLVPEIWENVYYTYDEKAKSIMCKILGTFKQYPIKPAWALTVHKSQGLTFNKVNIDFSGGAFTGGQTYVALSRCTNLEGIVLHHPVTQRDVFVNPAIVEFSNKFNSAKMVSDAIERAEANDRYNIASKSFDKKDFDSAVKNLAKAVELRNDLNMPLIQRFIRRKLGVINTQQNHIDNLKSVIHSQNVKMKYLAEEYAVMGNESLTFGIATVNDTNVSYNSNSIAVKSAHANYDKALDIDPDCIKALIGKADLYMKSGMYDQALSLYLHVVELENNVQYLSDLGECYICVKDWLSALQIYKRIIKASKNNPIFHERIAVVYHELAIDSLMLKHQEIAKKLRKSK